MHKLLMTFRKKILLLCMYVQFWTLLVEPINKLVRIYKKKFMFKKSAGQRVPRIKNHLGLKISPCSSTVPADI